jgi:YD repeat-containing protein
MQARNVFAGLIIVAAPAAASETITYQYDALGRLVQVTRTGTVNNGASAAYTYDPANNRTNVTTTAPTGGGGMAQAKPSQSKDQPTQSSGAGNASPRR